MIDAILEDKIRLAKNALLGKPVLLAPILGFLQKELLEGKTKPKGKELFMKVAPIIDFGWVLRCAEEVLEQKER